MDQSSAIVISDVVLARWYRRAILLSARIIPLSARIPAVVFTASTSPSGWNRFQPQIDPVKNRGIFFRRVISNTCPWIIRSKIVFLESVTFQLHARMLSSEVAQSLKSYGHFSVLGVGIALSHRHVEFFVYSKYINPRPLTGQHGYASTTPDRKRDKPAQCRFNVGLASQTVVQHWTNIGSVYRVDRGLDHMSWSDAVKSVYPYSNPLGSIPIKITKFSLSQLIFIRKEKTSLSFSSGNQRILG